MIDEKDGDLMTRRAVDLLAIADEMDARRDALAAKLAPKADIARALHRSGRLEEAIVLYEELATTWVEACLRSQARHYELLIESCRRALKAASKPKRSVRRKVG